MLRLCAFDAHPRKDLEEELAMLYQHEKLDGLGHVAHGWCRRSRLAR